MTDGTTRDYAYRDADDWRERTSLTCHQVALDFTSPKVGDGECLFGASTDEDGYSAECDALDDAVAAVLDAFVASVQDRWPGLRWRI